MQSSSCCGSSSSLSDVAMDTDEGERPIEHPAHKKPSVRLKPTTSHGEPGPSQSGEEAEMVTQLPSVAVSYILSFLHWKDKLSVVAAIPPWFQALCTVSAWPMLAYHEDASTKAEERQRVSQCVSVYGKYLTAIKLAFHYWYPVGRRGTQILHEIANHCPLLRSLHIGDTVWSSRAETALRRILDNCKHLRSIALVRPVLAWSEEEDNVVTILGQPQHARKLSSLLLTSVSLVEHEGPLLMLRNFTSLQSLKIRREELTAEVLEQLSRHSLGKLTVFLDEEVQYGTPMIYSSGTWQKVCTHKPQFILRLLLRNIIVLRSNFPASAPLQALVMVDLSASLTKGILDTIATQYSSTLQVFVYTKSYQLDCASLEDKRLPMALYDLAVNCPRLHTLVYGFQMSATTALMIAKARKLSHYVVLLDELTFTMDWPVSGEWTPEFHSWIKESSESLSTLELSITELLGFPWKVATEFTMWENVHFYTNL